MNANYSRTTQNIMLQLLRGDEILSMEFTPADDLIENLVQAQSLNFLAGEAGCGKSLLAMNLAIAVSSGAEKWLSYNIKKTGVVLYLNNELGMSAFSRRLKAMCAVLQPNTILTNLQVPFEFPLLRECWPSLLEICEREKPCLVIVDCFYFAHDADENDSSEMKAIMRALLSLSIKYSLAVLIVHHTRKGSRSQAFHFDQLRGSSVFSGAADTVLQMVRSASVEGKWLLKATKLRNVSDERRKCRLLSLDKETLTFHDKGEADEGKHLSRRQVITANENIDFEEIFGEQAAMPLNEIIEKCSPLGYNEKTIRRAISQAVSDGILTKLRHGIYGLS